MSQVILIDKDGVVKLTRMGGNVDVAKVRQAILVAQETYVEDALGTKLYQKLLTLASAGELDDAGNENYETLVHDYVQPMLAHYTMGDYILMGSFEIENGGIFKRGAEGSQNLSMEELDKAGRHMVSVGDRYKTRMVNHLCYYPDRFPEYTASQEDGLHPDGESNRSGIEFI